MSWDLAKILAGGGLVLATNWVNRYWQRSDRLESRVDQHQIRLQEAYEEYLDACEQYVDFCRMLLLLFEQHLSHLNDVDALSRFVFHVQRSLRELPALAERSLVEDEVDAIEESVDEQAMRTRALQGRADAHGAEADRVIDGIRSSARVMDRKAIAVHLLETDSTRRQLASATMQRPSLLLSTDREATKANIDAYVGRLHDLKRFLAGAFAPKGRG